MRTKADMDILQELAKPLVEYLRENYNPHCTIIVTDIHVKVVEDIVGIPMTNDSAT